MLSVLRISGTIAAFAIGLTQLSCSKTSNPYADRYRSGITGQQNEANSEDSSDQIQTNTPKAVEPEQLSEEQLSLTDLVCTNGDKLSSVKEEFDHFCQGGQPTQILSSIIDAPYTGSGEPTIISIKSDDVNGVSHISGATSFKISAPIAEVLKRTDRLESFSAQAGNASLRRNKQGDIAPDASDFDLGGSVLQETMTVRVAIITITDSSVSEAKGKTLKEGQAYAFVTTLKDGEAANDGSLNGDSANPRSNMLAIWLADGDETLVLVSFYQEIENQGRHGTVEQTASGIGAEMNKQTYERLSAP